MTNNFNQYTGRVEVGDRIRVSGFYSNSTVVEGVVAEILTEVFEKKKIYTYCDIYGLPIGSSLQRIHLTHRLEPKKGDYISVFDYKVFARMINELPDGTVFRVNGKRYCSKYGGADEMDDKDRIWRAERDIYKEVRVDKYGSGFEIEEVSDGKRYS